ncbi:MAG TPA: cytochrome P450 [Mycobacteriales bacterium]|nr:cytochrome P450 [Mycobacteriales bacterium]
MTAKPHHDAVLTAPDTTRRPVPGDPGLPLLGSTLRVLHDNDLSWTRSRYDRYGPVSWTNMFGLRMVSLLGPDAAGTVLVNRDKAFSSGEGWGYLIDRFFHRGLMLLDFEEHLQHRRIMQQAFTRDRLAGYLDGMNLVIERVLAGWRPGPRFTVQPVMKQLTLDVATETFVGARLGPAANRVNRAFIDAVRAGTAILRFPVPGGRWRRGLRGRRVLEDYLAAYLPRKRAHDNPDLFSALCHARSEEGERFTDEDVVNHMIFLLMAAHDTSTITLTAMAYFLAKHPGWQDRAREESRALGTAVLGFSDIDRLSALDLVIKESLRLITPVPAVIRKTVKDTEVLGHLLPAGTMVQVLLRFTHQMPEYWPEPNRFDPDRFANDRREDRVHPHAWEPFGAGVHKCIGLHFGGMEVKAVLHQLLLRYRWSVDPAYQMPIDWTSLPRPRDGLPVRLEPLERS